MNELLSNTERASKLVDELETLLSSIKYEIEEHSLTNIDEYISYEYLQESLIKSIHDHDYEFDLNNESLVDYLDSPKERIALFFGIISGYQTALFWACEYIGLLTFFENEIQPIFDGYRKKLMKDMLTYVPKEIPE